MPSRFFCGRAFFVFLLLLSEASFYITGKGQFPNEKVTVS